MNPSMVFLPSFLNAINAMNTSNNDCIRSIMNEDAPGVYMFKMLQPSFCHMLLHEVDHIEKWIHVSRTKIMMPNTFNNFGLCLDDFGMKDMLDMLLSRFVKHICAVLFPDVGGTLDSHHGYIVQYGMGKKDVIEDIHVDDSEVTLNICLGNEFTGGQLFFESPMCDKHVYTNIDPEKITEVNNLAGCSTLYRGCHRHGARATTSGRRVNLVMWCRSSLFRETKIYDKVFKDYCDECQAEKSAKRHEMMVAMTKVLGGDAAS
ncbi:2-oxoglutarate and iron-dependent oxygenase domain-containing protein ICU11-like [Bidens hawaiensis]|uniref:2-oxoglutarate and iron-dependent oxygenase domain-containing protein ICU11-like n=1 Tax=Bidens hawaiensis TaxID=980011 RepID=UPI00404AA54B